MCVKMVGFSSCHHIGKEVPFGTGVAFQHAGVLDSEYVTLYDVRKSNQVVEDHIVLQLDDSSSCLAIYPPKFSDLTYAHDTCAGIGGFSTAFSFLGCRTVTAVDFSSLACKAFGLNFGRPLVLEADLGVPDTICQMHRAQVAEGCHPVLAAGFPCQPLSRQGHGLRQADARSKTLLHVLRAAVWLGSSGILLECVPEAMTDMSTQASLHTFAMRYGFRLVQKIIHLHHVWPSRRSRWFAVLLPISFMSPDFPPLLEQVPMPRIIDVVPEWPAWDQSDEEQLRWTELEQQVYHDSQYGSTDRQIDVKQALPTALHSWGNALFACPCGCRKNGLSAESLRRSGLRGIAIISAYGWFRHIHPRELQILLGFPPFQKCVDDCRSALCLYGSAVSPIQCIWIWAHILDLHQLLTLHKSPQEALHQYTRHILQQKNLSWPPISSGRQVLFLKHDQKVCEIAFEAGAKIRHLLQAERVFQQETHGYHLLSEGLIIPEHAFLTSNVYSIDRISDLSQPSTIPVKITLCHFGHCVKLIAAAGMTISQVLHWHGIFEWTKVVDPHGHSIAPTTPITQGQIVVVQYDPEVVAFELAWKDKFDELHCLSPGPTHSFCGLGFGFDPQELLVPWPEASVDSFECAPSWPALGLEHLDSIVKNNLLATWSAFGFKPFCVWLPSFSAAILELWPCAVESKISEWLKRSDKVYVIIYETWGWNLLELSSDCLTLTASFLEALDCGAQIASIIANRARWASGKKAYQEGPCCFQGKGERGSLKRVLSIIDQAIGLPDCLVRALFEARSGLGTAIAFSDSFCISATLPLSFDDTQLPIPLEPNAWREPLRGLSAPFILDFARALLRGSTDHVELGQIKAVVLSTQDCDSTWICRNLLVPQGPLFIFVLCRSHWTLLHCQLQDVTAVFTQYDGLACTSLECLEALCHQIKAQWGVTTHQLTTTWLISQTQPDSCGTIALGHFAILLGKISTDQARDFEKIHPSLARCSEFRYSPDLIGLGNAEEEIVAGLTDILLPKGVAAEDVKPRALAAIKVFGAGPILKALKAKNNWSALKTLGNTKPKPFRWVTHDELQLHIQERATKDFGVAVDVKRSKKPREPKQTIPLANQIDPTALVLTPNVFTTSSGTPVNQIALGDVQKNATGVAFACPSDVLHFLADAKMISTEALAVLVVGSAASTLQRSLPMHEVRVPAIYRGTNEPVLIDCISIQLGDQAVFQKHPTKAPEVAVFPTVVFRVHVFRDLWEPDQTWEDLVAHPVKSLVSIFPLLRICREHATCGGAPQCLLYHPSLEEDGIESGLLDVWGFGWAKLDGARQPPQQAAVFTVYIRVPESSFNQLHIASGTGGVFFEPRKKDSPGQDDRFAVIWLPQFTLSEVQHRIKTHDSALTVCRIGSKYGIRCLIKYQETLHKDLEIRKPFVPCSIKEIYRIEPLPVGTQRQSLADMLHHFGWVARPLQPCKGSQGQAWQVGSETPPPQQFLAASHGWVAVSKVKDTTPPAKPQDLVATSRTKQHIQEGVASTKPVDPWLNGDPWGGYVGLSSGSQPPSQHVQQKIDDVESRLQESVKAQVDATMDQLAQNLQTNPHADRITQVENQMHSLIAHQSKLEQWVQAGHQQTQEVQAEQDRLKAVMTQCVETVQAQGASIAQVSSDVAQCSSSIHEQGQCLARISSEVGGLRQEFGSCLEQYFDKQSARIEALLEKKARHA